MQRNLAPYPRHDLLVLLGVAALIVLALTRPTAGTVIAPVIIQGDHNRADQNAPLPRAIPRATVSAMPDLAQHEYHAGEVAPEAGIYKPQGRLRQREQEARVERVARGLQVVHEAFFEVGDVFPELVGYEAGAVWVLKPAR